MLHMIVKRTGGGDAAIGHDAVCNTVSDKLTVQCEVACAMRSSVR